MNERTCRILLIEDDEPIRNRLEAIIEGWSGGTLVAACGTLAEATSIIKSKPIDLLIVDLDLPDGHGSQAIRTLRDDQPIAEAMVISVLADDRNVLSAIRAGATGYLLKDSNPSDIIHAIEELLAGRSPISSAIAHTIVRRLGGDPDTKPDAPASDQAIVPSLTRREMDILRGIARGLTYAELAEHLEISKQTVPVHIKNVYRKLHANSRLEAVYTGMRHGLI